MSERSKGSDHNNSNEAAEIGLIVSYSEETEIARIKNTLKKFTWLRENGYEIRLPHSLIDAIENNIPISDDDIRSAIKNETPDPDLYRKQTEAFTAAWEVGKEELIKKLGGLGLPLPEDYTVHLTRYGGGGSYYRPNSVFVNTNPPSGSTPIRVAIHEIVHLAIEDLIQKYSIEHWVKERIVDLIMNKFYPEQSRFQKDIAHSETINNIFERNFPNIEEMIKEVSKLAQ